MCFKSPCMNSQGSISKKSILKAGDKLNFSFDFWHFVIAKHSVIVYEQSDRLGTNQYWHIKAVWENLRRPLIFLPSYEK